MTQKLLAALYLYVLLVCSSLCGVLGDECKLHNQALRKDNCDCTYEEDTDNLIAVECNGRETTSNIFDSIPNTVQRITIINRAWNTLPPTDDPVQFDSQCLAKETQFNELTYLNISHTQVRKIGHQAFSCMPNVKTLVFDYNDWFVENVTDVAALRALASLEGLHLRQAFTHVADWISDPNCKPEIKCSKTLRVAYYPDPDVILNLSTLANLKTLDLSQNQLFGFDKELWCKMPNLETLHLSSNLISQPEMNSACLQTLTDIYLDNNLIQTLSNSTIEHFNKMYLQKLVLNNNLFTCDCEMRDFYQWLRSNISNYVANKNALVCDRPEHLVTQTITELTADKDLVCLPARGNNSSTNIATVMVGLALTALCVLFLVLLFLNQSLVRKKCSQFLMPLTRKARSDGYPYSSVEI